jgi:YesN/AraC family two-component response regulator
VLESGYTVLEAADAERAMRVAQGHARVIHLLLTDVVMPGASGRDLADRLGPLRPEMKIVYMSGYTDHAIVHKGVLEPGLTYLEKPFMKEDLTRTVRAVLDDAKPGSVLRKSLSFRPKLTLTRRLATLSALTRPP